MLKERASALLNPKGELVYDAVPNAGFRDAVPIKSILILYVSTTSTLRCKLQQKN